MNWVEKEAIKTEKLVWKYHNLFLFILSVVLAFYILKSELIKQLISNLGELGYLGVFLGGMFFTYALTTVPAISILYLLSNNLDPFLVALIGMLGAVVSDYLIFRLVKYHLIDEMKSISRKFRFHPHLNKKYIRILKSISPLIAGLIIASPLPDELAASILGAIKVSDVEFLMISCISNYIGIFIIAII